MNVKRKPRIPVNVISGPLGIGKTTMINHLLTNKPSDEKWAVLVNEYGLVGVDSALMETHPKTLDSPGIEIREVAGGCICCSAGFMFQMSLTLLLQRRPERLIIEPTGLAALSGVLDTLDRPGIREAVDVRSIICLLDPSTFAEDIRREQIADQVEAADVLLGSKADLVTDADIESFKDWGKDLFPPKSFVGPVEQGQIPLSLLDHVVNRPMKARRLGNIHGTDHHEHTHDDESSHGKTASHQALEAEVCDASSPIIERLHHSEVASTAGWICWARLQFNAKSVSEWLNELIERPMVMRIKAVFHTNEGWWSFNLAGGQEDFRPSGYRRDSRLEIIFEGGLPTNLDAITQNLRACMMPENEGV